MNLDPIRLGLAGGILTGVTIFLVTLICLVSGYGQEFLDMASSIYPGFDVTIGGSLLGFIYGFIDGFVGLFLLAWIYNLLGPHKQNRKQDTHII